MDHIGEEVRTGANYPRSVRPRSGARPSWSRGTRRRRAMPGSATSPRLAGRADPLEVVGGSDLELARQLGVVGHRSGRCALTSMWAASQGADLGRRPVRMLTTPPGTSEVASTSASVTAGSGRGSTPATTTVLPLTMTGASTETRPSSDESCGATHRDDAGRLGQREVEERPGHRVAPSRRPGRSCRSSRRTRPSGRSPRRRPPRRRRAVTPSAAATSVDELRAPALHHLGDPVEHLPAVVRRRARTSRRTPCGPRRRRRGRPCATPARRWRGTGPWRRSPRRTVPISERGNAPPM